jgi:hypothetical protein
MRRIVMLVFLFVLSITSAIAQSDEFPVWEIVERCIDEPVMPSDDWSFDGIIFLYSDSGVHGLNKQIDTPYIIAYRDEQSFAHNGSISPDGRWFAVPTGGIEYATMMDSFYAIKAIHVYSTDGRRESYIVDWEVLFRGNNTYSIPSVQWTSNNTFLYSESGYFLSDNNYEFNPFTGDTNLYEGFYQPIYGDLRWSVPYSSRISPDKRLWIEEVTYDSNVSASLHLFDIINENNTPTVAPSVFSYSFFWQPDSSHIIATINQQTLLFDRNGTYEETIFDRTIHLFNWQIRGDDFAFTDIENNLFVGNVANRQLTDTCLTVTGLGWSPSGELAVSDGERISIINFEDGTHYIAAYHEGSVFDWRVPPEDD